MEGVTKKESMSNIKAAAFTNGIIITLSTDMNGLFSIANVFLVNDLSLST